MNLIRLNHPIKQFRMSELEEIWLRVCFHSNMPSGNIDFNFDSDFMNRLKYPELNPFDRINKIGITSREFSEIMATSGVGFHNKLTRTISDSVFFLSKRMDEVSVWDLETLSYSGPLMARMFHHWVRPTGDPIRDGTALLNKRARNWMRREGFYLPRHLDRHTYRQYEQTYIWATQNPKY